MLTGSIAEGVHGSNISVYDQALVSFRNLQSDKDLKEQQSNGSVSFRNKNYIQVTTHTENEVTAENSQETANSDAVLTGLVATPKRA